MKNFIIYSSIVLTVLIFITSTYAQTKSAEDYYGDAAMKRLGGDYKGAIENYKKFVAAKAIVNNDDSVTVADTYLIMAEIDVENLKNSSEGLDYCNKAVQFDKEYQNQSEDLLFTRGIAKMYLKDYQGAINDFDSTQTMTSAPFYKGIAVFLSGNEKEGCRLIIESLNNLFGGCNDQILKENNADFIFNEFKSFPQLRKKCKCE
jgi:tetratricopeptide (TPR) repeat protein